MTSTDIEGPVAAPPPAAYRPPGGPMMRPSRADLTGAAAALGVELLWPPPWPAVARALHDRLDLARPTVYEADLLRRLHRLDPALGRAVLRIAGGWNVAPHDDEDFHQVLISWEQGCPDADEVGHAVACEVGGYGCCCRRVDVGHCRDCGLPAFTQGQGCADWHDNGMWVAVWTPTNPGGLS